MNDIFLYALVSVFGVSLVSLVGVFMLSLKTEVLKKYTFIFISVAVGALLGDAFIHLIPEALEESTNQRVTSVLIIGGILIFFIIEKFFHWHHHGEEEHDSIHPVGKLTIISDGIHNFIDGVIIAASFAVSIPVGIATTIAVVLHEIPQEIGDFSVLLHAGYKKAQALWLNFLSALTAILGVFAFFIMGDLVQSAVAYAVPIAAGGFIYIAMSDLIPVLHKTKNAQHSLGQIIAVLTGVGAMVLLTFVE